ncbi:hypothetical protein IAR63_06975 [Cylindrospermopsis curvispora GIHE-G1]|uniref:HEPN domain-containing protein n=3 Tax=Cylindrospermopsis TaxID=77021 RepID=A0A7H0F3V8_9CYAN|nr:hypothetical protein IAR63_06975 [Cylindrospermopsis curvispora GIHE-G1]TPX28057.1 hypothetical protein FIV49_07455 [Cylindrospermopsis raciborskii GIHE 2018]
MAIIFTQREMQKAWRDHFFAYQKATFIHKNNAHRLNLFYAVECGLKAVLMKRQGKNRTDLCQDITECQHDINKLLDKVWSGELLKLPKISISEIVDTKGNPIDRKINSGQINQVWRYGAEVIRIVEANRIQVATDKDIEDRLLKISKWIQNELKD